MITILFVPESCSGEKALFCNISLYPTGWSLFDCIFPNDGLFLLTL